MKTFAQWLSNWIFKQKYRIVLKYIIQADWSLKILVPASLTTFSTPAHKLLRDNIIFWKNYMNK